MGTAIILVLECLEAWGAFFRALRHQPPPRCITQVILVHQDGISISNEDRTLMKAVLPALISTPGITKLICLPLETEDHGLVFGMLPGSHITALTVRVYGELRVAEGLTQLVSNPDVRIRELHLYIDDWDRSEHFFGMLPGSHFTTLTARVYGEPRVAEGLAQLVSNPNVHMRELHLYIYDWDSSDIFFGMLPASHITALTVWTYGRQRLAEGLTQLLSNPDVHLHELSLCIFNWHPPELFLDVLRAIHTLTTRTFTMFLEQTGWDIMFQPIINTLTHPHATHALQHVNIEVSDTAAFFGEAQRDYGPRDGLWRLAFIPTLRSLTITGHYVSALTEPHLDVLRDCLRARAQAGAPPLERISFSLPPTMSAHVSADWLVTLVAAEAPSTGVSLL